jgi:hypothetical protein
MANPKLVITLHDSTQHTVQPTLEDRLRFETTLRKNKGWGPLADNALKLQPFLAWSAAEREGLPVGSWQEFTTGETAALDVEPERDEDGLGKGTPTDRSTSSRSSSRGGSKSPRTSSEES